MQGSFTEAVALHTLRFLRASGTLSTELGPRDSKPIKTGPVQVHSLVGGSGREGWSVSKAGEAQKAQGVLRGPLVVEWREALRPTGLGVSPALPLASKGNSLLCSDEEAGPFRSGDSFLWLLVESWRWSLIARWGRLSPVF